MRNCTCGAHEHSENLYFCPGPRRWLTKLEILRDPGSEPLKIKVHVCVLYGFSLVLFCCYDIDDNYTIIFLHHTLKYFPASINIFKFSHKTHLYASKIESVIHFQLWGRTRQLKVFTHALRSSLCTFQYFPKFTFESYLSPHPSDIDPDLAYNLCEV